MRPPPTRYKVVERGRRLEVIDTWSGAVATPPMAETRERRGRTDRAPAPAPSRPAATAPADSRDTLFTTQPWYDDKAPRAIRESYANKARVQKFTQIAAFAVAVTLGLSVVLWPWVPLLLVPLFFADESRRRLRAAATRWIDTLDQAVPPSAG
ncbi:hypothetical protein [Sphingomonas hengshuiensis]|uniref:Uncharacterized protein n=1 Tax=Sphingomonas hengshuiensis TaxID=1609977 RepID=A0A7U4JB36_9SPHN|nr:hypothetical protein [Sphingomonas hengshuiensis]AJP73551.1 hypothetical protein TS85_19780 [Sphingomonas hengshuiensis]